MLEVTFDPGHVLRIEPCSRRRELAFVLQTPSGKLSRQLTLAQIVDLLPATPRSASRPIAEDEPPPRHPGPGREPRPPRPDRALADGGLQLVARRHLLSWGLPDGSLLGDARRPAVEAASRQYRKLGHAQLSVAGWLELVAEALPADQSSTVRDVMTEAQLFELRSAARLGQ